MTEGMQHWESKMWEEVWGKRGIEAVVTHTSSYTLYASAVPGEFKIPTNDVRMMCISSEPACMRAKNDVG